jgi:hypothetical protein
MKLTTSLSVSAFALMPATAFAENSPSSMGKASPPANLEQPSNTGGGKFYPDWAAVKKNWAAAKKDAAPPSQSDASIKPNEVGNQQQGAVSNSSNPAKDQTGLVEKAERLLGTITGRSVGSNENESDASKGGSTGQSNPMMGEPKNTKMSQAEPKVLGTLTGIIEIAPGNQSAAIEAVASTTAALQGRTSVPIIIKGELKVDNSSAAGTR